MYQLGSRKELAGLLGVEISEIHFGVKSSLGLTMEAGNGARYWKALRACLGWLKK